MLFKFIILTHVIYNILSYIILPLYISEQNIDSSNDPKGVIQKLLNTEMCITFSIGSEKAKIKALLSHQTNGFIIAGKNIKNHKYDESLSKSYLNINNQTKEFYSGLFNELFLLSKENFYFESDNNIIKQVENLNFLLTIKSLNEILYEGIIGVQIPYLNNLNEYNLINNLKRKKLIDSYNWFLNFDTQKEGKMYIGTLPHMLDDKYKEINFKTTSGAKIGYWGLDFPEITYGNVNISHKSYQAYIHLDLKIFYGPNELMDLLDKEFFNYYINKNICFKEIYGFERNIFYYCKNTEEFDVKKFKEIKFKNIELETNFIFDYNDLFFYNNALIYFLILFREVDINNFRIGEIFFKKYNLVFNQDSKTIGYYSNINNIIKESNIEDNKNKSNLSLTNILLIIILVVILFFGFLLYKKRINRKLRANELEDKYQYIGSNDFSDIRKNKLVED